MPTIARHQTSNSAPASPNYLRLGVAGLMGLGTTALAVLGVKVVTNAGTNFVETGNPFHGANVERVSTFLPGTPSSRTITYKVEQGQGPEAIATATNPEVVSGPDSSVDDRAALIAAIDAQADGAFLQPGQKVEVPDINPDVPPADPNDPNIIQTTK